MSGQDMLAAKVPVRLVAFYLPQFHPIPENDEWWGKGFTEWTNVAKARPSFPGHYQPHIPGDLGFYDLRLAETRQAQADLARQYGIYGFAYYHYWLHGRRLLERPFNEVLNSGQPDFPFCLCWANENWTRAWDGLERHVLVAQTYSEDDDRQHIRWLAKAFQDSRYIRVNGKPLFLVYRASRLPSAQRTASIWRDEANRLGVGDLFLARVESLDDEHDDPAKIGFDAAVEFQPDWRNLGSPLSGGTLTRLARKVGVARFHAQRLIFDYPAVVERMLRKTPPPYAWFRCVTPCWDSTARRPSSALILQGSTPAAYEGWLRGVIETLSPRGLEENLIFINAWNEWGEGNHLEPCLKWRRGYLEATRNALQAAEGVRPEKVVCDA